MNRSPNLPDDPQFAISLRIVTDGDGVGFPYDPAFKTQSAHNQYFTIWMNTLPRGIDWNPLQMGFLRTRQMGTGINGVSALFTMPYDSGRSFGSRLAWGLRDTRVKQLIVIKQQ